MTVGLWWRVRFVCVVSLSANVACSAGGGPNKDFYGSPDAGGAGGEGGASSGACEAADPSDGNPCNAIDVVAMCTDQGNGTYSCSCSAEFEEREGACADVNNCQSTDPEDGNPCNTEDAAAQCTDNTAPQTGYTCSCSTGYEQQEGTCVEIDECEVNSNPCDDAGDSGATCVDLLNDISCSCSSGFAGALCDQVVMAGGGVTGDPFLWGDGSSAESCVAYLYPTQSDKYSAPETALSSGVYSLDPEGDGSAFEAYCDMATDGGGFTLLGVISGGDENNWATQFGYWADKYVFGSAADTHVDHKSEAWNSLDMSYSEILFERQYDGTILAQTILHPVCLKGVTYFRELFSDPLDTSLACKPEQMQVLASSATGLPNASYEEGQANGLAGSDTNGFCWNGGDNSGNVFNGHLLWNQSSFDSCLAVGHLGGVGVYSTSSTQYEVADITGTNWLNGTDYALTVIRLYARSTLSGYLAGTGSSSDPYTLADGSALSSCEEYTFDDGTSEPRSLPDAWYLVDSDGDGGNDPAAVFCNQTGS